MLLKRFPDVPVPTDFGLNYEDLNLRTPDGVVLRSYIFRQRKELEHHQAGNIETNGSQTDEDVGDETYLQLSLLIYYSLRPHDLLSSCFTGMVEIMDIAYLSLRCSISR
jgi:hypothetical protein